MHDAIRRARAKVEQVHPGKLDFVAFYLNDGVLAGAAYAVCAFCQAPDEFAADLGLKLCPEKCVVVPAAGLGTETMPDRFQGCQRRATGVWDCSVPLSVTLRFAKV